MDQSHKNHTQKKKIEINKSQTRFGVLHVKLANWPPALFTIVKLLLGIHLLPKLGFSEEKGTINR